MVLVDFCLRPTLSHCTVAELRCQQEKSFSWLVFQFIACCSCWPFLFFLFVFVFKFYQFEFLLFFLIVFVKFVFLSYFVLFQDSPKLLVLSDLKRRVFRTLKIRGIHQGGLSQGSKTQGQKLEHFQWSVKMTSFWKKCSKNALKLF